MSPPTNPTDPPANPAATWAGSGLWDFSVALYGRDRVRTICLSLQNGFDVDVNLILFCLWLGATGRGQIDKDDLAGLSEAVSVWHNDVVKPLRAARIRLRTPPPAVASGAAKDLRERIKDIELSAERIELDVLEESLVRAPVAHDHDRRRRDMADSLAAYLDFIDAPSSEERTRAIETLIAECVAP